MIGRLTTAVVAAAMVFTGAWTTQTYELTILSNCTADTQCYFDDGQGTVTGACKDDQASHSCASQFGPGYVLTGGTCKSPASAKTCICTCTL